MGLAASLCGLRCGRCRLCGEWGSRSPANPLPEKVNSWLTELCVGDLGSEELALCEAIASEVPPDSEAGRYGVTAPSGFLIDEAAEWKQSELSAVGISPTEH